MSESLSGFPVLKTFSLPTLTLTHSSRDGAKAATFHGFGASNYSFSFEPLSFFTWAYNYTVLKCFFHFFKCKIYRQYYNLTSFCTWLHAFLDQSFYFILEKISIYTKLCVVRRFYVRSLGAQSKQHFPTMCSEVLVNSGHQTRLRERGCTDLVQSTCTLIKFF